MRIVILLLVALVHGGCDRPDDAADRASSGSPDERSPMNVQTGTEAGEDDLTLREARAGFQTKLTGISADEPLEVPPDGTFEIVQYPSPVGELAAYLTPDPGDGQKRPAIIWITGGDCNTIGDVWSPQLPENDQSARAYRDAGIVMMFPSLRGGNQNPGSKEGFYGEVDDVIAAAEFVAMQPHVDPDRIYLGGHSTGGTLVLLVAEMTDQFQAVFSFGPIGDATQYSSSMFPYETTDDMEIALRSPYAWLDSIASPTFVFEGTVEPHNVEWLDYMSEISTNPMVRFFRVEGADHFDILHPTNAFIARKILDSGDAGGITISEQELSRLFRE